MVQAKKTPACNYIFCMPTRKYLKYIEYEVVGITPQTLLDRSEDWIALVLKLWEE